MYKVVGKNDLTNILDTVLENRGIENKESFLKPTRSSILSPHLLKNMKEAIEMFKIFIKKGGARAIVLVDSDP